MRTLLLILIASLAAPAAMAQALPPAETQQAIKAVPRKAATRIPSTRTAGKADAIKSNPCASYGPRFMAIEGTTTCVRVGGAISVETTVRR